MRTFEVIPSDSKFVGKIVLKMPRMEERFELMEAGIADIESSDSRLGGVKAMRKLLPIVSKFFHAVDLKHAESGAVYSSFDDLDYAPECTPIVMECIQSLVNGVIKSKN